MALTPNVAAGALIQSAWGNEIRDRTVQRFATFAELTAGWPDAAKGAVAVTLDTLTVWVHTGTAWRAVPLRGKAVVTTDASAYCTITHNLGTIPGVVLVTAGGPASGTGTATTYVQDHTTPMTATTARFRVFGPSGTNVVSSTVTIFWTVFP